MLAREATPKASDTSGPRQVRHPDSDPRRRYAQGEPIPLSEVPLDAVLKVSTQRPLAAALFRRGAWLWLVFEGAADLDADSIKSAGRPFVEKVQVVPAEQASAVRLRVDPEVGVVARRQGSTWIVTLRPEGAAPKEALEPEVREDSPLGPVVFLGPATPGRDISLTDPDAGDEIVVVPFKASGQGVARPYVYPQFRLLASAQGIAVLPSADGLHVRTLKRGVEIATSGEMHLSHVTEEAAAEEHGDPPRDLARVFGPTYWQLQPSGTFAAGHLRSLSAIARADEKHRETARLDLVRFYLSHGFGVEALGVLELVRSDRPAVETEPEFRMLRGMSRFLLGRLAEAEADFAANSLDGYDEAGAWRAAAIATRGRFAEVAGHLVHAAQYAATYPRALRIPLLTVAAESLASAGRAQAARSILDLLSSEPEGTLPQGRLAFLEGLWLDGQGRQEQAVEKWKEAIEGRDRLSRARAGFALASRQLETGEIDAAAAIEALEAMRFAWRGDEFELELLRRLGQLLNADGRHAEALRTLREAVTVFPDSPAVPEITGEMTRTFESLYLGGEADSMDPLKAIALFDEFRELTPAGQKGNEMIRRLADRLVAVDLLGRAAELLEDQVRLRLEGEERARVGARLALIYLLDQRPNAALDALEASRFGALNEDLARQRRHLKARALVDAGRYGDAAAELGDDVSPDADLVRAELLWKMRDWGQADRVLQRLASAAGVKAGQPLDDGQARFVLNRAVALLLAGNEHGLASLRRAYEPAMTVTPFGDAFRLLAPEHGEAGLIQALEEHERDLEGFQAFLAVYRDRLSRDGLSSIN